MVDDGSGWRAGARAGLGVAPMHERAEELGGTLVLSAAPGGGSRVLASIPLHVRVP